MFSRTQEQQLSRDGAGSKSPFAVVENAGLSTFPAYSGKIAPELLPVLRDEEEEILHAKRAAEELERAAIEAAANTTTYTNHDGTLVVKSKADGGDTLWMPDKICKVCYNCEDQFTMYRRRHHCRMCGQIFCDRCSSECVCVCLFLCLYFYTHNTNPHSHHLYQLQVCRRQSYPRPRCRPPPRLWSMSRAVLLSSRGQRRKQSDQQGRCQEAVY